MHGTASLLQCSGDLCVADGTASPLQCSGDQSVADRCLSEWTHLHIRVYLGMYQPNSLSSCSPSCPTSSGRALVLSTAREAATSSFPRHQGGIFQGVPVVLSCVYKPAFLYGSGNCKDFVCVVSLPNSGELASQKPT